MDLISQNEILRKDLDESRAKYSLQIETLKFQIEDYKKAKIEMENKEIEL